MQLCTVTVTTLCTNYSDTAASPVYTYVKDTHTHTHVLGDGAVNM